MTVRFTCDFCGNDVEYGHQLTKANRTGSNIQPSFDEIFPDMKGKDICNRCSNLPWEVREKLESEFLALYRGGIEMMVSSEDD